MTGQQPVIAVKGIKPAELQPAMQAILQEVCAAFVEIHAAFLIDQALQKFELSFSDLDLNARCGHLPPQKIGSPSVYAEAAAGWGSLSSPSRRNSPFCKIFVRSIMMMSRPRSLPTPVT